MSLESNIADLNTSTVGLLAAINTQSAVLGAVVSRTDLAALAVGLSSNLSNTTDATKGASLVGFNNGTVIDALNLGGETVILGREYAAPLHRRIMDGLDINIVLSGDSTTFGDQATAPDRVWELLPKALRGRGLSKGLTVVNSGHSGAGIPSWNSTYLAADLALTPDVYVVRWGLNGPDTTGDASNAAATISGIRTGLATIRASRAWPNLTVVLMTPNACFDDPHYRTRNWFQLIRIGLRQAARDFKCVFVDTYQYLQDAQAGFWITEAYTVGSGLYVHPANVGNVAITGLLADALLPQNINTISKTEFWNVEYPNGTRASTVDTSTYPVGLSFLPALNSDGYPYQGVVNTFSHASGFAMQVNYACSTSGTTGSDYATRFFNPGAGWTPWSYALKNNSPPVLPTLLALSNSWVAFDGSSAAAYSREGNRVHLSGLLKNGGFTGSTTIAQLPVGCFPIRTIFIRVACSGDSGATDPGGTIIITTGGTIQTYKIPGNYYLALDGVSFSTV